MSRIILSLIVLSISLKTFGQVTTDSLQVLEKTAKSYYDNKMYDKAAFYYDLKIKNSNKPIIQDWFSLGRSYYFDSSFALADAAFKHINEISPEWPIAFQWRARCNLNLDTRDTTAKGLAVPFYFEMIEKAIPTSKYLKEIKEAYRYIADYYLIKENYSDALSIYENYQTFDKDNIDINKTIDALKILSKKKSNNVVYTFSGGSGSYLITYSDESHNLIQKKVSNGYTLTYDIMYGNVIVVNCVDDGASLMQLKVTSEGKLIYSENGIALAFTTQFR